MLVVCAAMDEELYTVSTPQGLPNVGVDEFLQVAKIEFDVVSAGELKSVRGLIRAIPGSRR